VCTQALGQYTLVWQPCYKRAAVSGVVASLCSQLAADRMQYHSRFQQNSILPLRTLMSIVGGGIAGVSIEAARAKREQKAMLQIDTVISKVSNMSEAELINVLYHIQRHR
jgi:hypothetical protein